MKKTSRLNKHIYPKGQNPFTGAVMVNLKRTFIYPNEGSVRFQVSLDKNGQVFEIRRSYAQIIKDVETKKRFVKVTLGDRPRELFDRIKGRPFKNASVWIDILVEQLSQTPVENQEELPEEE